MAPPGVDLPGTTLDGFLNGRLVARQPRAGFRSGGEALLLAGAVPARAGEAALELGLGAGVAALALGARVPGLRLAGLEAQGAYAALARGNARLNGQALEVVEGDVAAPPPLGAFDHVLMNPPFFDRRASVPAREGGREVARGGGLAAWLALAARRLGPGGCLTLVQPVQRLPEILAGLALGSVEVLPLAPRDGAAPSLILLRARKGGRAPFRLLPVLSMHDGEAFAPWLKAVLRDGAAVPWHLSAKATTRRGFA